jgi:hypothetical protein
MFMALAAAEKASAKNGNIIFFIEVMLLFVFLL